MKKLRNCISSKGLVVVAGTFISFFGMTEKMNAQSLNRLKLMGVGSKATLKTTKAGGLVTLKEVDSEGVVPKKLEPNWGDVAKDLPDKLE